MDCINIMSWNVRGMNKVNKQKIILDECTLNKVGLVAFLETKIRGVKLKEVMNTMFYGWEFYSSKIVEGRILVIWNAKMVQLEVLQESDKLLHCQVRLHNQNFFCITFVYGSNNFEMRRSLWMDLAHLSWPSKAWMVLGDFNAVFNPNDRMGGRPITLKEMEDARQWLELGLVEEMKTMASAGVQWEIGSDHSMILIKQLPAIRVGVQPFHFYNMWIAHPQFREVVLNNWRQSLRFSGRGLEQISWKLLRLKHILKKFNWKIMGDVSCIYERSKLDYQQAHSKCLADPSNRVLCNEDWVAYLEFKRHEKLYASYLYQKSKIDWLRFGDANSSFFHASLKKRKLANRIVSFVSAEGKIVDDYDKVTAHFLDHFKKFLGTASKASGVIDTQAICYGSVLSSEDQLCLIKPFTVKEVKTTMFSIHSLKSPGPDGTLLSLIPKVDQPVNAFDFRPIACCNTLYKCISKMLCNRLKLVLPTLISQNQGAFIKNRFLVHNDFLENLLNALFFSKRFIRWIMVCLRGSSYSLVLNGSIQGWFQGARGLNQGDPISPLLFVMVMDYLTRLLLKTSKEKEFRFHPLCKSLKLVNLCFADDLLLFCKANQNLVKLIQQVFTVFTNTSGLSINKTKSRIYIGGLDAREKDRLLQESCLFEGQFPMSYLGVPLRPTKWRASDCEILIDKMRARLKGWASRHLSYAGRVQLINSVLLGIRSYWMNIFILPQKVVKAIDSLCRKFLWGEKDNRSKIHRISWDHVCRPKCFGGLGFKDSSSWNKGDSIREYRLKQDTSWYWRRIIKLSHLWSGSVLNAAVRNGKIHLGTLYSIVFPGELVQYVKAVWCRLSAPKHQFILWLAVNQKLLTRDWLQSCHVPLLSLSCPICGQEDENHTHLFFDCVFSRKILLAVQGWLRGLSWPVQFRNWIQWRSLPRAGWLSMILHATCAAAVYHIWLNRNHCWLENFSLPVYKIDHLIRYSIKARVLNLVGSNCTYREKQMLKFVRNL
ncbi:uncharacterized protein LOC133824761 [Humulus lupulus]|uniref:uncharacterized protein LOC133824761 n=1 Tax=Humulus lupulus TaxID=3486 RepID=UPI002B411924|nr:uncharacterized protein LOC133824761 [Humulus lupulus]